MCVLLSDRKDGEEQTRDREPAAPSCNEHQVELGQIPL